MNEAVQRNSGCALYNITEVIGIAAPVVRAPPGWRHFVVLAVLAGGPAIIGTWVGSYTFDPVLATVFLAIGIGTIVQVIWEVGKLVARDNARARRPAVNWITLSGAARLLWYSTRCACCVFVSGLKRM